MSDHETLEQGISIEIPLGTADSKEEEEYLEINTASLPPIEDLIEILETEKPPLKWWILLSQHYYKQNKDEDFLTLMKAATNPEDCENYKGSRSERVFCLSCLGAYYLKRSASSRDQDELNNHTLYNTAVDYLRKAGNFTMKIVQQGDTIDDPSFYLGRGVMLLLQNFDFKSVTDSFSPVIEMDKLNIPAKLGLANAYYISKDYQKALGLYRRCLQLNPNCPASVRLGIGQCLFQLEKYDVAKLAFERCLALDKDCMGAHIGLAAMALASADKKQNTRNAMEHVIKGYKLDCGNGIILLLLSEHFFFTQDFEKCYSFANRALNTTANTSVKAASSYCLGRLFHKLNDYDRAYSFYWNSRNFDTSFLPAEYGLGQILLYREEFSAAIKSFENCLPAHWTDESSITKTANLENTDVSSSMKHIEIMKILIFCYKKQRESSSSMSSNSKKYAMKILGFSNRLSEFSALDVEAWIDRAAFREEQSNPTASLECYTAALSIIETHISSLGHLPEIYNNMGVCNFMLRKYDIAIELLTKAMECIEKGRVEDSELETYFNYIQTSVTFNLARVYEEKGLLKQAEDLYKAILKKHPNYIDAYLRLGIIAKNSCQLSKASGLFKQVYSIDNTDLNTRSLMGQLSIEKADYKPALEKFRGILELDKNDGYAQVAIGSLLQKYSTLATDPKKKEGYIKGAIKHFGSVLKHSPQNVYAANGIGAILGEKGNLSDACDIFLSVREATGDLPEVWINMAIVYLKQSKFNNAIKMIENCQSKFHLKSDVHLNLLLAQAYFKAQNYKKSSIILTKVLHVDPLHVDALHNLSLAQQRLCLSMLKHNPAERTSFQLAEAKRHIKHSIRGFLHISTVKTFRSLGQNYLSTRETARREFRISRDLYHVTDKAYVSVKKAEEEKEKKINQQNALRLSHMQHVKKQKLDEIESRIQREKELEFKREKLLETQRLAMQAEKVQEQIEIDNQLEAADNKRKKGSKNSKGKKRGKKANQEDGLDIFIASEDSDYNSLSNSDLDLDLDKSKEEKSGSITPARKSSKRNSSKAFLSSEFIDDSSDGEDKDNTKDDQQLATPKKKKVILEDSDEDNEGKVQKTNIQDLFGNEDSD